jgi:hypothetical protein
MSPTIRDTSVAVVLACLLSIALTWPLAARLGSAGRVDTGDGRHGIWNVSWVAHALTTAPTTLFDANIFYPHDNALAFSEANLVAGVLAIPAWLLTGGNPYAAYNSVVLMAFALAALTMFALARTLGASRLGSAVAAIIYGYCPFMFAHIPHIQLLMTFGPALSLLMLHRFVAAPTTRRALALGAALSVTGLACGYYGIFAGLVVSGGLLWFALFEGRWRQPRYWIGAALAAAIVILTITPFFLPYLDIRQAGFGRTLDDARMYSTTGRAYFASAVLLHTWMLPILGSWREVLFPGFQALIFGTAALVLSLTYRRAFTPTPLVAFYAGVIVVSVWISFGPDAGLYTLLYHTLPAFSFLRAPARMGILVTLGLAVLTSFTLTWMQLRWRARQVDRPRVAWRWQWTAALIVCVAVAESWVGPLRLAAAPPLPAAHQRLAVMPRAPVAMFPFFYGATNRHRHTEYMLLSTFHWHPMINGYSDFMPEDFFEAKPVLQLFPSGEALELLRQRQVRWVVVHFNKYPEDVQRTLRRTLRMMPTQLRLVVDDPAASLYEVIRPRRPAASRQP